MIKRLLPISHLLENDSETGRELFDMADVLEFRRPEIPGWMSSRTAGKSKVFHWGLGTVMDEFIDAFQAEGLGEFMARIQAEMFSFDLGPGARRNLQVLPLSPTLTAGEIIDRSQKAVDWVRKEYAGPLAVENYNYYPTGLYEHICRPDFIAEFLEKLDLGLLLDLAHTTVSAANLNLDPRQYLLELPLDRVVCLHVSGPFLHPTLAVDAHHPPREQDFELLSFLLDHLPGREPVMTAIEYYRDLHTIQDAYHRLDRIAARERKTASFHSPSGAKPMGRAERLARKNAFDGSLVMGVETFNRATGRDRHRSELLSSLVDPDTGLLKEPLARDRSCPVCGDRFERPLFIKDGFRHGRCPECGLVYVNPVLTEEAATAYYRQESSWTRVLESGPQVEMDRLKYEYGLDLAAPYLQNRHLLDIGTGTGLFVRVAQSQGYDPVALELHRENVEKLKSDGFQVIDQTLESARIQEHQFDMATLWEVLEHIVDPRSLLGEIHRILKPKGILFILVPNLDSLVTRVLHEKSGVFGGHSHVNFFNAHTLTRL